jgi:hypothetical protein
LSVNVNVIGSDYISILRHRLNISAGGIGNAVKEVEHTESLGLLESLKIENHSATLKQIICDIGNVTVAFGVSQLKL